MVEEYIFVKKWVVLMKVNLKTESIMARVNLKLKILIPMMEDGTKT